jgi:hypothetical protein
MNRVLVGIEITKAKLKAMIKSKEKTKADLERTRIGLDMATDEYAMFQTLKSVASQTGLLTLDEAQSVYGFLGEVVTTFNNQPLEVKIVLTKLYSELLGNKIAGLL